MASTSSDSPIDCKIGQSKNEHCHKLSYCRKTGFINISELKQTDRELLQWRCEISLADKDQVCFHHEKVYLSRYENLQKYCFDPFSVHKKHITSKLNILFTSFRPDKIPPGQKLTRIVIFS